MPKLLHTGAFAHTRLTKRSFYTQKLLQPFHKKAFTQKLLHRDAFTNRSFYTQKLLHREDFAQRSFFTDKRLREGTLSTNGFYIQQLSHREAFAWTSFYIQVCFHRAAFMRSSFYTLKLWRREAFTQRGLLRTEVCFDTEKRLNRASFIHRSIYTHKSFTHTPLHTEFLNGCIWR